MSGGIKGGDADRQAAVPANSNRNPSTLAFEERLATLRPLMKQFGFTSDFRHLTARNCEKRLMKISAEISRIADNEALTLCNCRKITVALGPEEFGAEMNLRCPSHGLRRLGVIVRVGGYPSDSIDESELRLNELVNEYRLRVHRNHLAKLSEQI